MTGNRDSKPDFSGVASNVDSSAETAAGGKADFSGVRSTTDSTAGEVGDPATQTYVVERGDTLSHIAQRFYGKASGWHEIFEANRDQLDDPDRIQPGQVLKIPQISPER